MPFTENAAQVAFSKALDYVKAMLTPRDKGEVQTALEVLKEELASNPSLVEKWMSKMNKGVDKDVAPPEKEEVPSLEHMPPPSSPIKPRPRPVKVSNPEVAPAEVKPLPEPKSE